MNRNNLALGRLNYMICGAAIVLIILGFVLMLGSATTIEGGFEPDIFSTRRIVVAPMVCLFGFLLVIVGILYKPKDKQSLEDKDNK